MPASRRGWVMAGKAAVSAVFVALLARTVRLGDMALHFRRLDPRFVAVLLALAVAGILISCLKWRLLLRAAGIPAKLSTLSGLYLLGYFFNNFLPGMIGGDAARGAYLGKATGRYGGAYLSVFMERFTGLVALLGMALLVVLLDHPVVARSGVKTGVWLTLAAALPAVAVVFSDRAFRRLARRLPARWARMRGLADRAHAGLRAIKRDRVLLAQVMGLSLAFHLLTGLNMYAACRALRVEVGLVDMILTAPLIILVSLLPITINGIGLWEGSFAAFFFLLGIPESVAVAVALLLRLKNVLVSVLGWIVYTRLGPVDFGAGRRPRDGEGMTP